MSMIAYKSSGFPASRIIGSGTTLDTARLRFLLGKYFGVDAHNIHAYVIGEHGDSEFVPWSNAFVSTKSTDELCAEHPLRFSKDKLTELEQEVPGLSVQNNCRKTSHMLWNRYGTCKNYKGYF